uniref:Uncharacterized protein n=1 Tax=Medicago truncatula TaxID=3880 RepID=B7FG52_MEDTR|nr:unknown [Medicago truncatula]
MDISFPVENGESMQVITLHERREIRTTFLIFFHDKANQRLWWPSCCNGADVFV